MKTFVVCAALALTPLAAHATMSPQDAIQRILHIERENSAFLVKFPALRAVDATLRNSCAARTPGKGLAGGYCTCAAAVTMESWRSSADRQMLDRLSAFANAPDPAAALDFAKYQKPELYAPLCTAARLAD